MKVRTRYRDYPKSMTSKEFDSIEWDNIERFDHFLKAVRYIKTYLGKVYTKTPSPNGTTYAAGIYRMMWKGVQYVAVYKREWHEPPAGRFGA